MAGEEVKRPSGGFTDLAIAFTKQAIVDIVGIARRLLQGGWSEAKILDRLREENSGFSDRTLRRLIEVAAGRPVQSDFSKDEIASEKVVARHLLEIELKRARSEVCLGSVVHFLGVDWYVKCANGTRLTLQRLS
ncbi:MAG: hypothetical protein HYY16_02815 [Planctomycetes bacterium]|nr:hypothetical protein [Planctomycetota bacterium]